MKKILLYIIAAAMITGSLSIVCFGGDNDSFNNITDDISISLSLGNDYMERIAAQDFAIKAYEHICDYFADDSGHVIFPENYAGEYIINNKLHIYYTSEVGDLLNAVGSDYKDVVVFEGVNYSLTMLKEVLEDVTNVIPVEYRQECCISTKDNAVLVKVFDQNVSEVERFIMSSLYPDAVKICIISNRNEVTTTSLKGGDKLTDCTLSVCGTQGGVSAVISCGHQSAMQAVTVGSNLYLYSDTNQIDPIATISSVAYSNNHYGDYSIALVNTSSYSTTNKIKHYIGNYVDCAGGVSNIVNGEYLIKYGAFGGYAGIEVTSTTSNVTYSSWTIKGLVSTDVNTGTCIWGDSGGPIIRYVSSSQNYYYAGCLSGRSTNINTGVVEKIYFCPYSQFASEFLVRTW